MHLNFSIFKLFYLTLASFIVINVKVQIDVNTVTPDNWYNLHIISENSGLHIPRIRYTKITSQILMKSHYQKS
jgi:hypothetical protein